LKLGQLQLWGRAETRLSADRRRDENEWLSTEALPQAYYSPWFPIFAPFQHFSSSNPYDPHHNKFSPEPKAIDQSKLKIYNPSYPAIRIKWVMKGKMVEHYH
jgi:hypothetical protein